LEHAFIHGRGAWLPAWSLQAARPRALCAAASGSGAEDSGEKGMHDLKKQLAKLEEAMNKWREQLAGLDKQDEGVKEQLAELDKQYEEMNELKEQLAELDKRKQAPDTFRLQHVEYQPGRIRTPTGWKFVVRGQQVKGSGVLIDGAAGGHAIRLARRTSAAEAAEERKCTTMAVTPLVHEGCAAQESLIC